MAIKNVNVLFSKKVFNIIKYCMLPTQSCFFCSINCLYPLYTKDELNIV